jgi:hypothetical protein
MKESKVKEIDSSRSFAKVVVNRVVVVEMTSLNTTFALIIWLLLTI